MNEYLWQTSIFPFPLVYDWPLSYVLVNDRNDLSKPTVRTGSSILQHTILAYINWNTKLPLTAPLSLGRNIPDDLQWHVLCAICMWNWQCQ